MPILMKPRAGTLFMLERSSLAVCLSAFTGPVLQQEEHRLIQTGCLGDAQTKKGYARLGKNGQEGRIRRFRDVLRSKEAEGKEHYCRAVSEQREEAILN